MIRILHAADLHLDSPFAALPRELARQRREEQRLLLGRLADECLRLRCDLLLLAGDLFDEAQIYRQTLDALMDALARCGARVFIAPGNHDCLRPDSPYLTLRWPENIHIFRSETVEAVPLPELGCRVFGAGFRAPEDPGLLRGFRAPRDGLLSLMVLHGDPVDPGSPYGPITEQDILASGLDYLALGHVHRRFLQKVGRTTVSMPGCAMGRGFDECGEKGAVFAVLTEQGCKTEFVPLGARRYGILSVEVGADPLAAVLAALPDGAENDCLRIVLTGEAETLSLPALEQALQGRFYSLTLIDETLPPLSLWSAAGEHSLKGAFLQRLLQKYEAADEDEKQTVALAARLGLSLMEKREVRL